MTTPIRVVHFADVHLGIERYGRLDPTTGLSTRATDFLAAFDTVIDYAIEAADLVVFAGDAYKTRNPIPTYQREFSKRIMRLARAGLPTVLVVGNHDRARRAHTLDLFHTFEVENVHVAASPAVLDIETRAGPVQVGALPWIGRSALLARNEYKNLTLEQINDALIGRVEAVLAGPSGLVSRLNPDVPHIMVAHASLMAGTYGSERSVMLGSELVLPLTLFKDEAWDYVALGHLHRHQELEPDRSPPVVYSGSIERCDFGEEEEDKGFVVAEVERGRCSWEFHKLDVRRFVTVRIAAEGDDAGEQAVKAAERANVENAVVRVIIRTTAASAPLIDENEIKRALAGAFSVYAIERDVVRPERVRIDTSAMAFMDPLDNLRRYLEAKNYAPERITILMREAAALLPAGA